MAISNNYIPESYSGDGSSVVFTANWNVLSAAYMRVYFYDTVTGIQTLKEIDVDYTLAFDASGLSVDFTISAAPPVDTTVILAREVELTQSDPYTVSKGWQGAVIESSFDKLTAITQDLSDESKRSVKFRVGSTFSDITIADLTGEANKYIIVNDSEDGFEYATLVADLTGVTITGADALKAIRVNAAATGLEVGGLFVEDGDKGDIVISANGTIYSIPAGTIDNAMLGAGQITNSKISGGALIDISKFATQSANTIMANATAGAAAMTAVPVVASTLVGRGSSGNITGLTAGNGITIGASSISSDGVPTAPAATNLSGTSVVLTLDFTTYLMYELVVDFAGRGVGSPSVTAEGSNNAGSSYLTTGYAGGVGYVSTGNLNQTSSFKMYIWQTDNTKKCQFASLWQENINTGSGGGVITGQFGAFGDATTLINRLRLQIGGGATFTQGSYRLIPRIRK